MTAALLDSTSGITEPFAMNDTGLASKSKRQIETEILFRYRSRRLPNLVTKRSRYDFEFVGFYGKRSKRRRGLAEISRNATL
jgi:hypothetical protein